MIFDKEYHNNWQAGVRGHNGEVKYYNYKVGYWKHPECVEFIYNLFPRIILALLVCVIMGTLNW